MNHLPLVSTRQAFGEELCELGKKIENIVVLNADLSVSTRTSFFAEAFPERFFNAGIAEQNMMGVAAGLSTTGFIPIVSTLAVFAAGRAYDQIRNTICHSALNVKIAGSHSGISMGEDGSSHQSIEDIALMRVIPGMTVLVPADGLETKRALRAAIEHEGPVYMRLGRPEVAAITHRKSSFTLGRAKILRNGNDATIVACGIMVFQALKAADVLKCRGINVRVINMHTVKPLDLEVLSEAAEQTGGIVTAEDHSVIGGLGSAVLEALAWVRTKLPVYQIGIRDTFGESGNPDDLMRKYGLSWENIAKAVEEILSVKGV